MQVRIAMFFILFGVAPSLAYQAVQDELRAAAADGDPLLVYALGVAPNFLGALSTSAILFCVIGGVAKGWSAQSQAFASAAIALAGLWGWEVLQIWVPKATFDLHDLAWTAPGVAGFLIAARLWFGRNFGGEGARV